MKKVIFEIWAEMLADPTEQPDYKKNDFINEAMEWTGWDVQTDFKEKRVMVNEWYDEFRQT